MPARLGHVSLCQAPDRILEEPSAFLDVEIPPEAECRALINAYFEHSNFFSPIINRQDFELSARGVYGKRLDALVAVPKAGFMLCLVLAISVRLLNCADSTASTWSAEQYFVVGSSIYEDHFGGAWTGE